MFRHSDPPLGCAPWVHRLFSGGAYEYFLSQPTMHHHQQCNIRTNNATSPPLWWSNIFPKLAHTALQTFFFLGKMHSLPISANQLEILVLWSGWHLQTSHCTTFQTWPGQRPCSAWSSRIGFSSIIPFKVPLMITSSSVLELERGTAFSNIRNHVWRGPQILRFHKPRLCGLEQVNFSLRSPNAHEPIQFLTWKSPKSCNYHARYSDPRKC